jgi:hypothetical protein
MKSITRRVLGSFAVGALILGLFSPFAAEAATKKAVTKKKTTIALDLYNPRKKYADEKKDIANPTSRCLTAAAKKARAQDLKNLEADGKKVAELESPEHPLADDYKKYQTSLEFAWGAMEEPYCGFGAFGASSSLKSYQKTVTRARAAFLDAVKKQK